MTNLIFVNEIQHFPGGNGKKKAYSLLNEKVIQMCFVSDALSKTGSLVMLMFGAV
jgi:hypothetical protein